MRRSPTTRVVVGTAAVAVLALVASACAPPPPAPAADVDRAAELAFVSRINDVRAFWGHGGLVEHGELVAKARNHSRFMATGGCGAATICHSHLPDGITVRWRILGENVGVGPSQPALSSAFEQSPPHFANIVNPAFVYVGVGVVRAGGRLWVTEVFMA